jgi:hypothetical protein
VRRSSSSSASARDATHRCTARNRYHDSAAVTESHLALSSDPNVLPLPLASPRGRAESASGSGLEAAPTFTDELPPAASTGSPYTYVFLAQGYPSPTYAVASGTLPPGLTLDPATGMLSGTATGPGTFTVAATNTDGTAVTGSITITINTPGGGPVPGPNPSPVPGTIPGPVPVTSPVPGGKTTVAGAPKGLKATNRRAGIVLRWIAPSSNGGSAITGYEVYETSSLHRRQLEAVSSSPLAASARTFTAKRLENGTRYYFTIRAINHFGTGAASKQIAMRRTTP